MRPHLHRKGHGHARRSGAAGKRPRDKTKMDRESTISRSSIVSVRRQAASVSMKLLATAVEPKFPEIEAAWIQALEAMQYPRLAVDVEVRMVPPNSPIPIFPNSLIPQFPNSPILRFSIPNA